MLGTNVFYHPNTIDYFPILKNFYKIAFGFLLGDIICSEDSSTESQSLNIKKKFYNFNKYLEKYSFVQILQLLGKNSLFIYMVHLPIVFFYSKRNNFKIKNF